MRGLESTDTPGLFKHKSGSFWGRISVGGKQRYKSFRSAGKTDATGALARWRKELEIKHSVAGHQAGKNDARSVGYFLGLVKGKYARSSDIGKREKMYCNERIRGLMLTWPEVFRMKAATITFDQIEAYKHRCRAKRSASTTRGNLLFLRIALDQAVKRGVIVTNPMKDLEMPGVSRAGTVEPQHELSADQFDAIIEHMRKGRGLSRRASELAELMASTACRVSEAIAITWAWVDWDKREVKSPNAKGRKARGEQDRTKVLPFFPRLEDLLIRLKARYGDDRVSRLVKVKECGITLENACEACKLPRLTQHDLRHLFSTWAIEAGIDIPTVAGWLGHTDGGALLMARYHHHRRKHSQSQASKMPQPASANPASALPGK